MINEFHKSISSYYMDLCFKATSKSKRTDIFYQELRKLRNEDEIQSYFTNESVVKGVNKTHTRRLGDIQNLLKEIKVSASLTQKVKDCFSASKLFPGKRFSGIYTKYQEKVFENIKAKLDANNIIYAGSQKYIGVSQGFGHGGGEAQNKGLAGGHAYAVLSAHSITGNNKKIKICWLYNPWGEYTRVYIKEQEKWKAISYASYTKRKANGEKLEVHESLDFSETGIFAVELNDLIKKYRRIYAINIDDSQDIHSTYNARKGILPNLPRIKYEEDPVINIDDPSDIHFNNGGRRAVLPKKQ